MNLEWELEDNIHKAQVDNFAKIWLKNRDLFLQAGFKLLFEDSICYLQFKGSETKKNDILNLLEL